MINGTTTRSKIGYLVAQSPKNNRAFVYAQGDSADIIGVVQSEVPPNQQAQILSTGTAKVSIVGTVQRGDIIRARKKTDKGVAGQAIRASASESEYFRVGIANESGSGLVSVNLQLYYVGVKNASEIPSYTHPTGFTNQPTEELYETSVISQIIVTPEGHVSGVQTKSAPFLWKRDDHVLRPINDGDSVEVIVSGSGSNAIVAGGDTSIVGIGDSNGVYGFGNVGVYGETVDNIGVQGYASGNGNGVYGTADGYGHGVEGIATGIGYGLKGNNAAIGDVSSGDYIEINKTGHMKFNGAATIFDDVRVPANDLTTSGSNDPNRTTWLGNLISWSFSATQMNQLFFECQIPHGYKEGSTIYPHIHWRPLASAASPQRVRWGLEYVWQNIGEAAPVSTTTIYTSASEPSEVFVGNKHYVSPFNGIVGTGKTISSMLSCRIFRDATNALDDFTGAAGLMEIDFHVEMDTIGSDEEWNK